MPINVFGNSSSSYDGGNNIDTSLFVQKPYLRSKDFESIIEEDIDLKNQFRIENSPDPIATTEPCCKIYLDNKFNDPSKVKKTTHVDFNNENLENVHSIKVNSLPTPEEHLTPKNYVDQAISEVVDESSFLRLDTDEKLDEKVSITLKSSLTIPKTILELPAKSYVDRRINDPIIIKNTAHVDFNHKKLDKIRLVKVNSMPAVQEHLIFKYYVNQAIF